MARRVAEHGARGAGLDPSAHRMMITRYFNVHAERGNNGSVATPQVKEDYYRVAERSCTSNEVCSPSKELRDPSIPAGV